MTSIFTATLVHRLIVAVKLLFKTIEMKSADANIVFLIQGVVCFTNSLAIAGF